LLNNLHKTLLLDGSAHVESAAHTRHITPNQISGVITTLTISELKETRPAALQGGRSSFFVTQWGNLEHALHPAKKALIRKEGVLRYGNYREALDVKDDEVKSDRAMAPNCHGGITSRDWISEKL